MNPIMTFLKSQPARISSYIFVGILIGNWAGVTYPKQSVAFWAQPIIALVIAIATVMASMRNNKDQAIAQIVAKYQTPPDEIDPKDAKVLAKAGVELPQ